MMPSQKTEREEWQNGAGSINRRYVKMMPSQKTEREEWQNGAGSINRRYVKMMPSQKTEREEWQNGAGSINRRYVKMMPSQKTEREEWQNGAGSINRRYVKMMPSQKTEREEWQNGAGSRAAASVEDTGTADDRPEDEDSEFIVPEKTQAIPNEDGFDVVPEVSIKPDPEEGVPARYIFSVLGFLAFFLMFCLRTCPNVAMVAMVNSTALASLNSNNNDTNTTTITASSSDSKDCAGSPQSSNDTDTDYEEGAFVWDERTQGTILGAFYYSYTSLQLLGGWVAERVRPKRLLGGGLLLSSLLSFAIPPAARAGPACLVAVRVVQGLVESAVYPAMHVLCSQWVPVHERSKLVSFSYSGSEMGTVCGMLLTGVLSKYGFAGGWPSAFYVFGMFGCVWFLLWMVLVYDSPADHPRISDRERRYIQSSVGEKKTVSTPWRSLLTSAPVWGVCIAHTAYNWGYFSMFTSLPTYMRQILGFHIIANGFLSALPYLTMWVVQVVAGFASDCLRRHCTTAFVRKLLFSIGSLVPACLLVGAGYVDCDQSLAVLLVTLGVTAKGMAAAVVMVNHLDFAPRFAGILFGLSNTFATIPGFVAPALIGILTYQNQTIEQWQKFFYITGTIYVISIVSFLCLGRGEVQPWAAPPPTCTVIPNPLLLKGQEEEEEEELQLR